MEYQVTSEDNNVKSIELKIPVVADSDGYFDRECPNCYSLFKVTLSEWSQDDRITCPSCGHISEFDEFDTEEIKDAKIEAAYSAAFNIGLKEIKEILGHGSKNGFMTMTIKYPPEYEIKPILQSKAYRHNALCGHCGCHYAIVGPALYCPKCGEDTSVSEFHNSIRAIRSIINDDGRLLDQFIETMGEEVGSKYYRSQKEGCVSKLVSSFQFAAETIYKWFRSSVSKNLFQRINDSNNALREVMGHGFEAWITDDDIQFLIVMFNQRHLYEHHGGIVDEKYLKSTGDKSYSVGQRLRFNKEDCNRMSDLLETIILGMRQEALEKGVSELGPD